ncbi:hypothetical protein ABIF69_004793 [Bradyrhizobium japonicum]
MMDMLSTLFALVGYVVVGVGAVGAFVWWLFRTFSEKWLNAKFEERLAAYKHEQQKELEHLKFEINAQMDPVGRSKSPGYGHLKLPHLMIAVSAAEQQ